MPDSFSTETFRPPSPMHGQEKFQAISTTLKRNEEYVEHQKGLAIAGYLMDLRFSLKDPEFIQKIGFYTAVSPTETPEEIRQRLLAAAEKIAINHDPYNPLSFSDFIQKAQTEFGLTTEDIFALRHFIIMHREAQRSKTRTQEAQQTAEVDPLTGVLNRRGFERRIKEAFAHSQRTNEPLSIIYIDADALKYFNDTHGHQAGDELIKAIAQLLQLRESDIVCRLGGDEFVVILPNTNTDEIIEESQQSISQNIAARLRQRSKENPFAFISEKDRQAHSATAQFSIGFTTLRADDTAETLLARAEQAMQADKQQRKQQNPDLHIRH